MKLPKTYFESLSTTRYRQYLKMLPALKSDHAKAITMLIFTFAALSFLGVFAINPTLTTIVDLQQQLKESEDVHEKLVTKMNNLSNLQQQYNLLAGDLPVVYDAIPQQASVPLFIAQVEALAKKNNLTVTSLQVSQVPLTSGDASEKAALSFVFSLEAEGTYDNMTSFLKSLTNFSRIVNLESVGIFRDSKSDALVLNVKGREFFKK
jgi:Tfp pilus assembly protein PilO